MSLTGIDVRLRRQQHKLSQANLAELSGVSQHLLSAFELGKTSLPLSLLDAVAAAFANEPKIAALTQRSKRYQRHTYEEVKRTEERAAKVCRNAGNVEYCSILNQIGALHNQETEQALSALSLFSGCGGFSLGFSSAGFHVKGFLERDGELSHIYKENFPIALELGGDITKIEQKSLYRLAHQIGAVDVVFGGPPCQGFSLSGKRQAEDPRNALFKHYLRFVDAVRPKMAVLENVRLLTSMKNSSGEYVKDELCQEFTKHGYNIRAFEINAKNYGVPQHRERVIFIAIRNDLDLVPTLPEPTHADSPDLFSNTRPCRTFADACSDLPFLESGQASQDLLHEAVRHPSHVIEWLWNVPEGRSAHDNEDAQKRPPSGYNTTYKRQIWNEPAATVQTTFGMISGCRNVHPIATRSLTVREAARIQSFPDSYHFAGKLGTIRTGIGNAVPPLLAFQIALHAKKCLLDSAEVCRL